MKRNEIIQQLKDDPKVSVLIVGAGINGIGVFRDLALNSVNVLIADKGDYCSGASSASSHMAHGGIRYLENGEFGLVREAVQERNRMIDNAPHRVKPLPTTIPIFKIGSGLLNAPLKFLNLLDRPAERGAIVIKTGLMIYDSFTHKQKTVPRHQFHNRSESLTRYPMLNPQVKFTATYFDGEILSPERYCIDLIHDAMAEGDHAKALNYVRVEGISGENVSIKDESTGDSFNIAPKVIVNAAGPWIDKVNINFGLQEHYIGGTKGSHIVLDVPELRNAIGDHEFFFENKDGRIVLILPFYDKVVVGTTDIQVENIDDVVCTVEEEGYFIDLIARIFPAIKIRHEDIVFRFSGVRPLEHVKAKTAGQITRDHSVKRNIAGSIPVLSMVGGKWTSYRAFSEQAANEALSYLGIPRVTGTAQLKVNGGEKYPKTEYEKRVFTELLAEETGISTEYANALFLRYGTFAKTAANEINAISIVPLKSIENWTQGEVRWLIRNEDVVHLEDLFLRRTSIAWLGNLTGEVLLEFAAIFAEELGLSENEKQAEILKTFALMDDRHGVKIVL